ncbi:MAG: hypothetical protein K6F39_05715 [Lachnospiraceae bacterium]|nr:hypothetical protein [Lachnospiraceae bacterium]
MANCDIYVAELTSNLKKFVDDTVTERPAYTSSDIPDECYISQNITGDYSAVSAVYGEKDVLRQFSVNYAKMELEEYSEVVDELASDFLNLHNGLFVVRLSREFSTESSLDPPMFDPDKNVTADNRTVHMIPYDFSFGSLTFVLIE